MLDFAIQSEILAIEKPDVSEEFSVCTDSLIAVIASSIVTGSLPYATEMMVGGHEYLVN
jgi:hydrogenase-4 membrane subunit HyfE